MFFSGFAFGVLLCFVLLPLGIAKLYGDAPKINHAVMPVSKRKKNQIVISYSYIIPLAVLALLFAVIVGLQITKILATQGHGKFVYFSLSFPVFGFLIGYLYFKRMVKP